MQRLLKRLVPDAITMLAIDGAMGLESYNDFKPDLVITDWNMPKKNGGEVAKSIKNQNPSQRIILWSGSFYDEFEGYHQYFDEILTKTVDIETLKNAITGVMHHESPF